MMHLAQATPKSMIPNRPIVNPIKGRSIKCKITTAVVGLVALLVVVLLPIELSKRLRKQPKLSVILPLYSYPDEGVWDPLYTA